MISATITLNDGAIIRRIFDSWGALTDWLAQLHGQVESVVARQK